MKITKTLNGDVLTVALEGRLDTTTAPELDEDLKESAANVNELIMDLEKLEYISSAGLRVLLTYHKAMMRKDGMKILHANEMIMEVFDITGFSEVFTIE